MDNAQFERLVARVDQLESRHFDNRDRIVRTENQLQSILEQRADLKVVISEMNSRLANIERQVGDAKAGWKTLVAIGGLVGGIVTIVIEFFLRKP